MECHYMIIMIQTKVLELDYICLKGKFNDYKMIKKDIFTFYKINLRR